MIHCCKPNTTGRGRISRLGPAALAILLLLQVPAAAPSGAGTSEQWRWTGVERVVAVGDIHGAYSEFLELLKATGIIDDKLAWRGGKTHLVSLGDLLDRGHDSRKVMDLLMRLQGEAQEQGGRVHVVVGNHETMNLTGDLRYVSRAEFAAFADLESKQMRDQAYQDFIRHKDGIDPSSTMGRRLNVTQSAEQHRAFFDDRFPPGFFGHRSAFSASGRYGKWLLSLPTLVVVNNSVYVHGGLSPITGTGSLEQLNQRYFTEILRYLQLSRQLTEAGVLMRNSSHSTRSLAKQALEIADPTTCSKKERSACEKRRTRATGQQTQLSPESLSNLHELIELDRSSMFSPAGPLWYRGSVRCNDLLEQPVLQAAMEALQVQQLVVGHTPTYDRLVHVIRDQQVVLLDTGMLHSYYKGRPAALLAQDDRLEVQYLDPERLEPPKFYTPDASYPLSETDLLNALQKGAITRFKEGWLGRPWEIEVNYKGTRLSANFFPENWHELAAYELDRLLGFDLIPATVSRIIGGEAGSLQLRFPESLSESLRLKKEMDRGGRCSIDAQYQLAHLYDLLIGKESRGNKTRHYMLPSWTLFLTDNSKAFGTEATLPRARKKWLEDTPEIVQETLRELSRERLEESLGALLGESQLSALLQRRDAILAEIEQY